MGRRGQRQVHRLSRQRGVDGGALPRRPQRGPHARRRRRGVQAPARAERRALPVGDAGDRQRRRRRSRGAARRDRHARGQGHRHPPHAPLGQRAPDHAVPPGARPGDRALPRQEQARDDQARHRPDLRRQGPARRAPRAGPARPEDLPREARSRAAREERRAHQGLQPAADGREGDQRALPRAWCRASRR